MELPDTKPEENQRKGTPYYLHVFAEVHQAGMKRCIIIALIVKKKKGVF